MLVSDLYCPSCRNAKDHKPQDNEVCWSCVAMGGAGNYKESKTNYDLIIRKSPEELAEFIGCDPMHDICPNNCHEDPERPCTVCILEWLKREAEDG